MHFRDSRPPHEIKFQLERDLMILFRNETTEPRLVLVGGLKQGGATYGLRLSFDAALFWTNCYTLRVGAALATAPPGSDDNFGKSAESWFSLWTRHYKADKPPEPDEGSPDRYRRLVEQSLSAETDLIDVHTVQQEILGRMRKGAKFFTAHKEGGTTISFNGSRFMKAEYGESEMVRHFANEAEFLDFLANFYDWETSRSIFPNKVPECDKWKLILRLLQK